MSDSTAAPPAAEEQKSEIQDDYDDLDELEKNFQRVISDIVTDKYLEPFRVEYEKIYALFVQSIKNNTELVKRAKALNSEILANSTKVNSVLQLSQDDERTIAGLRFEFDKAWKMVELSQEKENKSRDVIDAMKLEVSNLSKLVETGGALAFTQETSLQTITDEVKNLTKEIKLQADQIVNLTGDYETSVKGKDEIIEQIEKLKNESEKLNQELEETRANAKVLDKEAESKSKEMLSCKDECKISQDEVENNSLKESEQKKKNQQLSQQLFDENKTIREVNEDKKDLQQRVHLAQKLLEDKKKQGSRINELINLTNEKIEAQDTKKEELMKRVNKLNNQQKDLEKDYGELKLERKEVEEALNETHSQINRLRDEIYKLSHEVIRGESQKAGASRTIALMQIHHTKAKNEVFEERKKRKGIEGQRDGIENDLMGIKAEAHKNRMTAEKVKNEIEHYSRLNSDTRSNLLVIEADKKINHEAILQCDAELRDKRERITKQESLAKTVLQQRDLVLNQLEAIQHDCEKVEDDNLVLTNEIKSMKEMIREKDVICVAAYLKKSQIETALVDMRFSMTKLQGNLKEAVQTQCTLENRLMRTRYLRDVALNDLAMLKRGNERLEHDYRLLELSVHKKAEEVSKLKEKCRVLISTINATSDTYQEMARKVGFLKDDLIFEVKKVESLRNKSLHSEMLKLEQLRLEKAKLQTQGKVRALEDELETPIHIHRWRFLEGTNPEAAQMIKMTHVLRGKLMVLMAKLQRFKELAKKETVKVNAAQKHLSQSSKQEHDEAMKFFEGVLRQKTKQLQMLQAQIVGQQECVDDSKLTTEQMRQQLRDTKLEYFNDKIQTERLRSKTQLQRKSDAYPVFAGKNESRFIGGGFAISTQRSMSSASEKPKPLISVGGPIKFPKVNNSISNKNQKVSLKGWNPARKPLNPLLPTVSQLAARSDQDNEE
ncbi:flagellar associated protein [Tritrichomonas foetus]|uniref:Flagellar associated protein n=1 Tax=Tritrichomonas foetus TaxID=1144522 RepID=A0A1J4JZ19_9EUKA|nr:flagellar associated protein [Tritrichomonas foetus]|eukprot:OHT04401.1 flagellar associated protein [Tritrichomonas foetus]